MSFGDISFSSCVTWGSRSFNPVCIADTNQSNAEENYWEKENQWAPMSQRIGEWKQTTWGTPLKITNQQAAKKNNKANRANINRAVFVDLCLTLWPWFDERNTDAMTHPIYVGNISTSVFSNSKAIILLALLWQQNLLFITYFGMC